MGSFDNYVYYSICEKSYEMFKLTGYSTYRNFCKNIKNEIDGESRLDNTTNHIFWNIGEYIKLIYGFEFDEAVGYIINYFLEEKYMVFEEPVVCIASAYKNSFN